MHHLTLIGILAICGTIQIAAAATGWAGGAFGTTLYVTGSATLLLMGVVGVWWIRRRRNPDASCEGGVRVRVTTHQLPLLAVVPASLSAGSRVDL